MMIDIEGVEIGGLIALAGVIVGYLLAHWGRPHE